MRWMLFLGLVLTLAGCKEEDVSLDARPVRTVVVDLKPIGEDRHARIDTLRFAT